MKHRQWTRIVTLLLLAALLTACTKPAPESPPSDDGEAGSLILDFDLERLDGTKTSISSIRNRRPALLEFWGST